jgi:hypothetical protein
MDVNPYEAPQKSLGDGDSNAQPPRFRLPISCLYALIIGVLGAAPLLIINWMAKHG